MLNLWSALGVLLLLGIVKKNSILQVDYTNVLRRQGLPLREALVQASETRLRPILMTTAAIIAGLIPTTLGVGAGATQRADIAVTIVGGQTLCLFLTLLARARQLLAGRGRCRARAHVLARADREAGARRRDVDVTRPGGPPAPEMTDNRLVVFDNPVIVLVTSLVGALAILAWRIRETQRPISPRGILLPPLGMSTGLGMFAMPAFRVPWTWALGAFALGALALAYPLIRSSKLRMVDGALMMQRSRAFLAILLGLVAVRLALRDYVGQVLPARETASVFFLLAFGMIVRWRLWMYGRYRAIMHDVSPAN